MVLNFSNTTQSRSSVAFTILVFKLLKVGDGPAIFIRMGHSDGDMFVIKFFRNEKSAISDPYGKRNMFNQSGTYGHTRMDALI